MINPFKKFCANAVLIILFITPIILFHGCASKKAAEVRADGNNLITDIITSEDAESSIITVKSNRLLTYTSIRQAFPLGVLFHFSETALENIETDYSPPGNDTIGSIIVTEIQEDDKTTTSRMFIELKKDVPYDTIPGEGGLQIVFPKTGIIAAQTEPEASAEKSESQTQEQPSVTEIAPEATLIKSVAASPLQKNVLINVKADGSIKNYTSFAIDNPPRIVFDMFDLKSPYKKEQKISVRSEWVQELRYYGHPDKVRLVLAVDRAYLSNFSATPIDEGLLIHVGQVPSAQPEETQGAVVVQAEPPLNTEKREPEATAKKNSQAAWVNRIDFSSEEAGKSAIVIGTTLPVKYELIKVSEKNLHLKLFDTNLPDYRNRALITTRFESAVDRVTPIQTPAMKEDTLFAIELREAVPYFVEQTDNIIRVNFAASSIPPKPYEDADLPAWKKVMAETEIEPGKKVVKATTEGKKEKTVKAARPEQEPSLEERLAGSTTEKKYTGEKIALDFYDTDIKNVFRIIREISGKNFAIDKNVTGKVTLTLEKPVPWDQVLDLVLKMNQLGMTMEGDIIRIASLTTLAQEEKLRQAQLKAEQLAMQQQEALEPLMTVYIPVNYSNAKAEIMPHVQQILSEGRGKVSVDERNNQIILTDTAAKIIQAREIVEKIDQVTPQVIIEARVVEANTDFARDLGFDWGAVTLGQFSIGDLDVGPTTFFASNLPDTQPTASLGFNFFKLGGTDFTIVDARLEASESEGKTNILSAPKIVTLDNKKAKIKQGFEVPYLERDSSGNATVQFKDVDLLLEVTPSVTPDDRISMRIFITKNDLVDPTAPEPALSTNEAETEILLDDGDTVVIGGILKSSKSWNEDRIPGLGKLPVLGWLFKSQSNEDDKRELLIFITPHIVRLEQKRT